MTKTQNKKTTRSKAKAKGQPMRQPPSRGPRVSSSAKLTSMMAYDRMLRDPCAAAPARAPYQGTDSGYLARTVDFWSPVNTGSGTAGTIFSADALFQVTPRVYLSNSVGPQYGAAPSGGTLNINNQNPPTNFITATAARWRPLAACIKWIPNGPYQSRQGTVSMGYSASSKVNNGVSGTALAYQGMSLETSPNGSQAHEIRWLPAAIDQNWIGATNAGSVPSVDDVDGASMYVVLKGCDATQINGTQWTFNGYFEVTTVWEWEPPAASGGTALPTPPPPFTISEHQSTIGDIGGFLLRGVRALAGSAGVQRAGMQLLTRGFGAVTRAAGLLTLA